MPDYFVGNAPSGASYTPPRVDFSAIGDAPDTYFKGTQQRRIMALQNAFPNGIPVDERGQPDFRSMANTLIKLGGADAAQQTLGMWLGQQAAGQVGSAIAGSEGQGTSTEPRLHSVDTGPANITMGQQPRLSSRGTDNAGADTIRSLATELSGGQDANGLIRAAAMQFRVGPDQELSPEQAQVIKDRITQLRTGGGGAPAAANDLPGPSPSGMVAGPGAPPQQGGQPAAQPAPAAPQMAQAPQAPPGGPVAPPQPGQGGNVLSVPPQFAPAVRDRYVKTIALLNAAAANPNLPAASQKAAADQATALKDRVKAIDEFWSKRGEVPNEIKVPASMGMNPAQYKQFTEIQGTDTKRSEDLNNGLQSMANISAPMLENLRQQKAMVNNPEFTSGNFNEAELWLKRQIPSMFGQPTSMELYRKTLAESISTEMSALRTAAEKAGETGGRIFMPQIKQIETMSGGLDNSVTGLRALAEIRLRTHQRNIDLANYAAAYKSGDFASLPPEFQKYKTPSAPGLLGPGFERGMRDWMAHHPLFEEKDIADPRRMGAREPPPGINTPADVKAWSAKVGLKSSEPIRLPPDAQNPKGRIIYSP